MNAEKYLRDLVARAIEEISALPESTAPRRTFDLFKRVRAAADALIATGSLAPDAALDIIRPLEEMIEAGPPDGTNFKTITSTLGGLGLKAGSASPSRRPVPPREPAEEPLAIVPIVRDLGSLVEGHRLILTAVEIWTRSTIVRYTTIFPASRSPVLRGSSRPVPGFRTAYGWRLEDDVGSTYARNGGGAHGGMDSMSFEDSFAPRPPAGAKTLTLVAHRVRQDEDDVFAMTGKATLLEEVARVTVSLPDSAAP